MFPYDFLSEPINAELCSLIVLAPLSEEEKQGWLEVLPLMDETEKKILIENLKEEVEDFAKLEKMSLEELHKRAQSLTEA